MATTMADQFGATNQQTLTGDQSDTAGATTTPTSDVSQNLQDVLQEGGAYLTQARQQGTRTAAARGLGDSSIAAQASQGEAIRAALPIAQQQATQQFQTGERIGAQEYQTAEADRALERQKSLTQMQQDFEEEMAKWQLGATVSNNLRGQYNTAQQEVLNQYAISVNQIETAQDISTADKNAMINNSINRRNADLQFLQNLYQNTPGFDTEWSIFPSATDATTGTTGTGTTQAVTLPDNSGQLVEFAPY